MQYNVLTDKALRILLC